MAYSDSRWDEVEAGRVYPKHTPAVPVSVLAEVEAEAAAEVRERLNVRATFERNRARRDARLVKPAAYKNLNASNGSGPSGVVR
jgi:hypothetical protein